MIIVSFLVLKNRPMSTLTWQIKKDDFGFAKHFNPTLSDTEYSIGDDGIKITENGQTKFYSWNDLAFFYPYNIGGIGRNYNTFRSPGFRAFLSDIKQVKNWPNEKIGNVFRVRPRKVKFSKDSFLTFIIYAAGYNSKDVFEALKSHLPIWNNFFCEKIIGSTIGYLIFISGFLVPVYYAIFEKWTPIFGLISGLVALCLLYFCIQNIAYFFKLKRLCFQRK